MLIGVAAGSLALQIFVVLAFRPRHPAAPAAFGALFFVPFFISMRLYSRAERRLRHTLAAHDGHLCPSCEHPLPPAADGRRTCTECGLSEADEEHLKVWKRWAEFTPRDTHPGAT